MIGDDPLVCECGHAFIRHGLLGCAAIDVGRSPDPSRSARSRPCPCRKTHQRPVTP